MSVLNQYKEVFICGACGNNTTETLNTYKNIWAKCTVCNSVTRFKKSVYPFESIIKNLPEIWKLNTLKLQLSQKKQFADFYNYYLDEKQGYKATSTGTKWHGEFRKVQAQLKYTGIELKYTSILDLSGEPGFFCKDALEYGVDKAIVTGYEKSVVNRMQSVLGLNAIHYDYNSEIRLNDLLHIYPDIVFIRHSISFCLDLVWLFSNIQEVLNKDGYLYISAVIPTTGACLLYMFDDYTYLRIYSQDFIEKCANDKGFVLISEGIENSYHYTKDGCGTDKLIFWIYEKIMCRGRFLDTADLSFTTKYYVFKRKQ